MAADTDIKVWRYRVVSAWGALAYLDTKDEPTFLLEDHDRGPETTWTVMSFELGRVTGAASGVLENVTTMDREQWESCQPTKRED